jgi:molecular chaperone HscC
LGTAVNEAIITVPAYFSNHQRQATRNAGQLAGLKVKHLLNEPTAAALAYGLHQSGAEQRILVLDLGGGTFDVSILEMFDGVMEVRATAGDNRLGGDDFSAVLIDGFMRAVGSKAGVSREGPSRGGLRRAAELAKRALTAGRDHGMELVHDGKALVWPVTREDFDRLAQPLLGRMRTPIERAIRDSGLRPDKIDHLVLAGGATRMPMVRRMAAQLFDRLPIASVDPDEVVVRGAAVQAGLAVNDAALADRVMTDVAPFTLGISTAKTQNGNVLLNNLFTPIIERNTVIPASRFTTVVTVQDYQKRIALKIYQGEGRMVEDNIFLGTLEVPVPPDKRGMQAVKVRLTYDTSGLLEVDATVTSTQMQRSILIENQPGVLSPVDIAARLEKLALLKVNPREEAENVALLARAERLYSERLGVERDSVGASIDQFLLILDRQDPAEIGAARAAFADWLNGVDGSVF